MQMQVRYAFARIRPAVDHNAVTGLQKVQLFGYRARREQQFSEKRRVRWRRLSQSRDDALGNDQDVHRRLRIYIVESKHVVIFPDDVGGNFTPNDFFENGQSVPWLIGALSG